MAASALSQIALDVLAAVQAKHDPPPETVNELRRARPDLDHLPIGDLACEIFFAEQARRQEEERRNWLAPLLCKEKAQGIFNGCAECTRLWRVYTEATGVHWTLDKKLQAAIRSHNQKAIQKFTPAVQESSQRRMAARDQIILHERNLHNGL